MSSLSLVFVLSHYSDSLAWLADVPNHPHVVYSKAADPPAEHFEVPKNVAGEATSYLRFIIGH
jgi:hypothetical protein